MEDHHWILLLMIQSCSSQIISLCGQSTYAALAASNSVLESVESFVAVLSFLVEKT